MANFRTNASGATSCQNFEPMQIMVAQFETDASGSFWWINLQSVQVAPSGGQNCNQWTRHHMVAKFSTCKWQVAPSSGQIRDQFKWCQMLVILRIDPSGATCRLLKFIRTQFLGPLCLWQCLLFSNETVTLFCSLRLFLVSWQDVVGNVI